MTHKITLIFEDGATLFIDCKQGETVLDAAYRQKINLPMDCSDGVCGTCKCRCIQGKYELGDDYIEDALSPEEEAESLVLTCQMLVSSDCLIEVPVPSSACKLKPTEHEATVRAVTMASDTSIVLTITPDAPEALKFLPGQYVNIIVPGTDEHRSYSFSSKPRAPEASFLIRNVDGGLMSEWLTQVAKPGNRVKLVGPQGSFFLREITRPTLTLAGGTGLAPFLSMLEVLADLGVDLPVRLIYGVTSDADLVETDRIEALGKRLANFTWLSCVAAPASNHPYKGYVTDHLRDRDLHDGDCDIYLCGPPAMVESVRMFLRDKGVTPAHFHYEKFIPAELAPA
jgi:benzoate/toluate 1,2-dioxygenase reductase subunit